MPIGNGDLVQSRLPRRKFLVPKGVSADRQWRPVDRGLVVARTEVPKGVSADRQWRLEVVVPRPDVR